MIEIECLIQFSFRLSVCQVLHEKVHVFCEQYNQQKFTTKEFYMRLMNPHLQPFNRYRFVPNRYIFDIHYSIINHWSIRCYNDTTMSWKHIATINTDELHMFAGILFCSDKIYVMGGITFNLTNSNVNNNNNQPFENLLSIGSHLPFISFHLFSCQDHLYSKSVKLYDLKLKIYENLPDMNNYRDHFTPIMVDRFIYVFGFSAGPGRTNVNNFER